MSGCLRLFACRTASVTVPARQALWSCATSTVISLRHAARRTARAPAATPRKKKKSSTGSPFKVAAGADVTSAAGSAGGDVEDKELGESNARLSMRLLMTSHFNYTGEAAKMERKRRHEDASAVEGHLETRHRRLLEKDDNAMRLLAADGVSMGDGIIPLASAAPRHTHAAGASAVPGGGGGAVAAWRTLNPVGLAASQAVAVASLPGESDLDTDDALSESAYAEFLATRQSRGDVGVEGEGDDGGGDAYTDAWKSATLATLSKPDLSVYDTDHDFRINSEEALRLSQKQPPTETPADVHDTIDAESADGADAATTFLTRPGASRMAAAAMQQKLEEDEDMDYTIAAYTDGADDPLSL